MFILKKISWISTRTMPCLTCPIPIHFPWLHSNLEKQELCTHNKCENQQHTHHWREKKRFRATPKAPLVDVIIWTVWFPGNLCNQGLPLFGLTQRSFILNNLPSGPLYKSIRDNCLASELPHRVGTNKKLTKNLKEISGEWVIHRDMSQTAIKKEKKYHWNIPQGKIVLISFKRLKSSEACYLTTQNEVIN